jgi:hypothetical protein
VVPLEKEKELPDSGLVCALKMASESSRPADKKAVNVLRSRHYSSQLTEWLED